MVDSYKDLGFLKKLQDKGVQIPCPESVEIGKDVSLDRISGDGVVIHSGCRIFGPDTLIMAGTELGYETPVTVDNCQIGRKVNLNGGYCCESVFLDSSSMGSGAQIRSACLLEEGASGAHNVGLKHTVLLPYVTLGSLINFCDCLMAGGTDEKNHSEVGSSYIHFNYSPNQDKATPSLIGDVARGVMMNQSPIFLGGQGGIIGPVMVEYGTVVAAGTLVRKDLLKPDTILLGHKPVPKTMPFRRGLYSNLKRIVRLNTIYMSNLIALRRWYLDVRCIFMKDDEMESMLYQGAVEKLDLAIKERIERLGAVAGLGGSPKMDDLAEKWQKMEGAFQQGFSRQGDLLIRRKFLEIIEKGVDRNGKNYLAVIKGLSREETEVGISWLQGIVDEINQSVWELLPGFSIS